MKRKIPMDRMNKHTRTIRKYFLSAFIGILVISQTAPVYAVSNAEKEKQEAQKKMEEANQKAKEAESKKNEAEDQVSRLTSDLTALLTDIAVLETDMANKEVEIKEAQKEYEIAKEEEEEQYQAMKKRIQYMYEKGDTEYLDIFLQVESISELLNKAEYAEGIYTYDRKMLEAFKETKEKVADYKEGLEEDIAEMEGMELEYKDQKKQLEALISKKKEEVSNFDNQLAVAKKEAEAYAKTVEKKNQEIKAAKEAEARKKAEEEAKKNATKNASSKSVDTNNQYTGPAAVKSSGGSAQGREVADYALQFIGNPYVYGGTSLTNGADCSGFTQSVYRKFGYSLPRTSTQQRSVGREVSYAEAQPGDLICYAGHVAIYIGNGQIVHASSAKTGIKTNNADYRTILSVRRII